MDSSQSRRSCNETFAAKGLQLRHIKFLWLGSLPGVDADEELRAVVGDEEPEGEEAAVVLPAVAVVAAGETLLHVQYESEVNQTDRLL